MYYKNCIYRCYVTMRNGSVKMIRVAYDRIAHIVSEFRKMQRSIFRDRVVLTVNGVTFTLSDVVRLVFKNERTGDELLTVE